MANQWVKSVFPTENALRLKTETPTTAATVTGAGLDTNILEQGRGYPSGGYPAMAFDLDSDTPQPVLAYISRSVVYVVDQSCHVVAYGRLVRRARA